MALITCVCVHQLSFYRLLHLRARVRVVLSGTNQTANMIPLPSLILTPLLTYTLWSLLSLERNVRKAKALGDLPIVRVPVDGNNAPWMLLQPHLWRLLSFLFPTKEWSTYPDFIRFSRRGWFSTERADAHIRLGPVWALVSPACVQLQIADPDAIRDIFATSRRKDFARPFGDYKILEVYGPCLSSQGWEDWSRQRKLVAAPLGGEALMGFVWGESLRQARGMVGSWVGASQRDGGMIPSVQSDTRTLSLNILASTGFGKSYDFRGSADLIGVGDEERSPEEAGGGGYRDALQTVLDNAILLMLIPYRYLQGPLVPKRWKRVADAAAAFRDYMQSMLDEETRAFKEGNPSAGGLMAGFVQALHGGEQEKRGTNKPTNGSGISIPEIFGNVFLINYAGHDTTANTLAFALMQLAANPDLQSWLSEEITAVTSSANLNNPDEEWDYKTLFPKLDRCRAVLLETLRVYPPVMALPRVTAPDKAVSLTINGRTFTIPPATNVNVCLMAAQMDPRNWGEDSYKWDPKRWIIPSGKGETVLTPSKNTYFPWSEGLQNCPGKKFSEVEAVAVLAWLFREHRVEVVRAREDDEETEAEARKRAEDCANDVDQELLLRMRDADRVKLRVVRK